MCMTNLFEGDKNVIKLFFLQFCKVTKILSIVYLQ